MGLQAKSYAAWSKEFGKWLSQSEKLELLRQRDLKLTSNPGESDRDFQIRVQDAQRVARDAAVDALNKKYASKRQQIEEQKRRAAASVDRESAQASQQKRTVRPQSDWRRVARPRDDGGSRRWQEHEGDR